MPEPQRPLHDADPPPRPVDPWSVGQVGVLGHDALPVAYGPIEPRCSTAAALAEADPTLRTGQIAALLVDFVALHEPRIDLAAPLRELSLAMQIRADNALGVSPLEQRSLRHLARLMWQAADAANEPAIGTDERGALA